MVEAALFEQHRWDLGCEAMYRVGLQQNCVDIAILDDMLRTFGVARNLSSLGKGELQKHLPEIASEHREDPNDWARIFALTGSTGRLSIPGSATKGGEARTFVSGLTKVLWFVGTHQMPMFDSLTSNAVKPSGNSQVEKAIAFYKALRDSWGFEEVHSKLKEAAASSLTGWRFFPERFIDKLLLIKGLPTSAIAERFLMGNEARRKIYLTSLPESTRKELADLAGAIPNALNDTKFATEFSK